MPVDRAGGPCGGAASASCGGLPPRGSPIDLTVDITTILIGAAVLALAAFLGGATGFGQALTAAPVLLAIGVPLAFVVTANLSITLLARLSQSYRFRRHASRRRAAVLAFGSVPGVYLGAQVMAAVDESRLKLVTGLIVMAVAAVMLRRAGAAATTRPLPGGNVISGFAGGFLASTTSLNGVAPVLLLARERAEPLSFMADLAIYYVVSSGLALAMLVVEGTLVLDAFAAVALWLPGALLGNLLGTSFASRLPGEVFRRVTLFVAFGAGALTALAA